MLGETFVAGEIKAGPGFFVRWTNQGETEAPALVRGVVAVVIRAGRGPLNEVVTLRSVDAVGALFGDGGTTDVAREALRGRARRVLAVRAGDGGDAAGVTLVDDADADAVQLDAYYVGEDGDDLSFVLRDSLSDVTKRELLVYRDAILRQTITFTKGAGGDGEPQSLVDAVAAANAASAPEGRLVTATLIDDGSGVLEGVALPTALDGGAAPTVDGDAYDVALGLLELEDWNVLAVDSEDTAIHAAVQAFMDRLVDEGGRRMAVLGEPTSVDREDRLTNSAAFNDPAIVYVANGFIGTDGTTREGATAAARVAGMIARSATNSSLTGAVVTGGASVVDPMKRDELDAAIAAGALVFSRNLFNQVQVHYGITTFITPTEELDEGWKKIRRVRTRYDLVDRVLGAWALLRVSNNRTGRGALIARAESVIRAMVAEEALLGGEVFVDPDNAPAGDSAWFKLGFDDLDGVERVYVTLGTRFAPPADVASSL